MTSSSPCVLVKDPGRAAAFRGSTIHLLDELGKCSFAAEGNGVRLQQVRQDQTLFPVFTRKVSALGAMVEFRLRCLITAVA